MIIKTAELRGAALDWAVGVAVGHNMAHRGGVPYVDQPIDGPTRFRWRPSTNWRQGGPLIESSMVDIVTVSYNFKIGAACGTAAWMDGDSYLQAAMRAIVAAKLGDEVEVPDELAAI